MPASPRRGVRILSLGDSYTIGEGVDATDRWPARLASRLRESGMVVDDPVIIAQTGWTTDELSSAIDSARPDRDYDLVTLLIGVNNQYRGRSLDEYEVEFRTLLRRAIGFAGTQPSRVVVISIPDWGTTPFASRSGRDVSRIGAEIDSFNAVGRAEASGAGAKFVDVTAISRRASEDRSLIAGDGLHPSRAMYEEWATVILPVAIEALLAHL
jgi:lysophospholipase L1-like esterase